MPENQFIKSVNDMLKIPVKYAKKGLSFPCRTSLGVVRPARRQHVPAHGALRRGALPSKTPSVITLASWSFPACPKRANRTPPAWTPT
jgi:hypothetical protein